MTFSHKCFLTFKPNHKLKKGAVFSSDNVKCPLIYYCLLCLALYFAKKCGGMASKTVIIPTISHGCFEGLCFLTSVHDLLHLGNKLWLSHRICLVTKSDLHNSKYSDKLRTLNSFPRFYDQRIPLRPIILKVFKT